MLDPSETLTPVPDIFYFRKASNGTLEYSSDANSWKSLTYTGDNSWNINFIFGKLAAKPSSLFGSVYNGIDSTTVSYPGGTSAGYEVYSEYHASGNDNYNSYTDYSKEYYCEATGFVKAIIYTSDRSDYPAWTYERDIDLISYKIYNPDGTISEGGE